ncbi:tripartite-type tricarboxylate transporter receptor subunit TctC [Salsuginibacillus halophilus]|uniref:Tripartite-type tricarboxylate transporter receptor subunit TctC n=1 Tax=Salsuginibacillus halophilus TaxID=517424 RepID=A0A2P8HKZ8_9BACI|nr:tripartite tricarboxylate transporter substrate binding protein [Salsuginibacillus halophilus]PSL46893.1 tripartite-type tricarboxylate transporter receptor subunit TctC [Salsuginibacillus halophilus]
MSKFLKTVTFVGAMSLIAACGDDTGGESADGEENGEDAAANYPEENVTMIVPFSAGGTTDVNARLIEDHWSNHFDTNLVIEYREGAGGEVGFTALGDADADGYTIGNINVPHIYLQPEGRDTDFDLDSFAYTSRLVSDPQLLAVHEDSEFETLDDFMDALEEDPGSQTVGIVGTLTGDHITTLQFMDETGLEVNESPFPGASDVVSNLLGGHIDAMMGNLGDVITEQDSIRVLGIATEERHDWLPDAPTFEEQGVDLVAAIDRGVAFPEGTPDEIVETVQDAIEEISNDPDYEQSMEDAGLPNEFLPGDEWEEQIRDEADDARDLLERFEDEVEEAEEAEEELAD